MLTAIIPTYNRSSYVRECLLALRALPGMDLEVIVADDGSTDDTAAVVKHTDPHAKYLWQPNSGTPATARNNGFRNSHGRFVGFLDCDDLWLPAMTMRAVAVLERYQEVDVVFGDAKMGNSIDGFTSWILSGGQAAFFHLPHREPEPGIRILEQGPFFRRMAVRNPVFLGACIMRREAFEHIGQFDAALCGAADWELWLRMASRFTFAYVDEPLAIYTRHLDNMSSNHDSMGKEFCQALENVLKKCDLPNEDVQLIKRQLQHHRFEHAYLAYNEGRWLTAKSRFWQAIRAGNWRPRTWAYFIGTHLPGGFIRRFRGWKHRSTAGQIS